MRPKTPVAPPKERICYMCSHAMDELDYKDLRVLQKFVTSYGKIVPRRRSGSCMKHQRIISQAVKRARIMALLPFVVR